MHNIQSRHLPLRFLTDGSFSFYVYCVCTAARVVKNAHGPIAAFPIVP